MENLSEQERKYVRDTCPCHAAWDPHNNPVCEVTPVIRVKSLRSSHKGFSPQIVRGLVRSRGERGGGSVREWSLKISLFSPHAHRLPPAPLVSASRACNLASPHTGYEPTPRARNQRAPRARNLCATRARNLLLPPVCAPRARNLFSKGSYPVVAPGVRSKGS